MKIAYQLIIDCVKYALADASYSIIANLLKLQGYINFITKADLLQQNI